MKVKLESADTVVVGVGANIAVERPISEARENLENRISQLENTRRSLQQQLTQVIQRIQDGRSKLEALTAKLSQKQQAERKK